MLLRSVDTLAVVTLNQIQDHHLQSNSFKTCSTKVSFYNWNSQHYKGWSITCHKYSITINCIYSNGQGRNQSTGS